MTHTRGDARTHLPVSLVVYWSGTFPTRYKHWLLLYTAMGVGTAGTACPAPHARVAEAPGCKCIERAFIWLRNQCDAGSWKSLNSSRFLCSVGPEKISVGWSMPADFLLIRGAN